MKREMLKRTVALVSCMVFLGTCFLGCGGSTESSSSSSEAKSMEFRQVYSEEIKTLNRLII